MPSIQIDDEVFAELQKNARPFVDTPNSTLRRLLKIRDSVDVSGLLRGAEADKPIIDHDIPYQMARGTKAPKASLEELIRAGILRNGETLFLIDYKGKRVPRVEANVANGLLAYKGKHFSMSDLARALLKKEGHTSDSVRGPAHWENSAGISIMKMWQQVLQRKGKL